MARPRNIVILGASNAGLAAAHYTIRHILPKLRQVEDATYVIHLVDPSTHFWWHIAAPRAIVSVEQIKHAEYFRPIVDGFTQYNLGDTFVFHQASARSLDIEQRTVTLATATGIEESLSYYALIIATGIRSPTPLTTLHGDHRLSQAALESMNKRLATACEVVIGGGGPVGVETAGEIAAATSAHVTLVAGADKLIPIYSDARATKVRRLLEKLGVRIIFGARVVSADETSNKQQTIVRLDNGDTLTADAYIPASGVQPNTAFLPPTLRTERGWVATNPSTLRVDNAGPRVYALGDVAGVSAGGMLHLFDTVPIFGANFAHDLLADVRLSGITVAEKSYSAKTGETQLVPVGPKAGVGAFNGHSIPGFVVSKFKGSAYMKSQIEPILNGKQFKKA